MCLLLDGPTFVFLTFKQFIIFVHNIVTSLIYLSYCQIKTFAHQMTNLLSLCVVVLTLGLILGVSLVFHSGIYVTEFFCVLDCYL